MQHTKGFIDIVNDAKARVEQTDIVTIKTKLDNGDSFHLIDVREESEYACGHLPNAIHLSKGVIERDIENTIPDINATIVLYCGGGSRSALAADNLQKMNYKNVISMNGGFRAWKDAGYLIIT